MMAAVEQKKQEMRFLVITFVLVLFLGGASFMSVMSIPTPVVKVTEAVRNPASLPTAVQETQPQSNTLSKLDVMNWDCKAKNLNSEITGTHLRLKGKSFCRNQAIQEIQVKNRSNGFTATVFENEKGFLTDFIDLKPGANDLSVEYTDQKGETQISSFTIFRKQ